MLCAFCLFIKEREREATTRTQRHHKQTDNQTNTQTDSQIDRQTDTETESQRDTQTDSQTATAATLDSRIFIATEVLGKQKTNLQSSAGKKTTSNVAYWN